MSVSTTQLPVLAIKYKQAFERDLILQMLQELPIKKILLFAFITSPLFGLFSSTPVWFMPNNISIGRVAFIFSITTGFALYVWGVNIGLVFLQQKIQLLQNNGFRFITSVLICAISAWLLFTITKNEPHRHPGMQNEFMKQEPPPGDTLRRDFDFNRQGSPLMRHGGVRLHIFPILQSLATNLIVFILLELIVLRETKNKVAVENEQLKLANSEARNNQLKQQLHPHFLFNSLSTLRSLINRSPEQAGDYLEKLSELLRFSTNNSQQTLVQLKEEIELCTNYLNMQKVRFGNALNFKIDIAETLQQQGKVPVYSLQSLAENAIKHNILTKEKPLLIEMTANENNNWILIKNNLQPKQTIEGSNGVGLSNLSERYRLLAGDDIDIKNENGFFSVRIKILTDGNNNN